MPSSGEIYTLSQLANATGSSISSLATVAGGVASPIDFEDFSIASITTPTTDTSQYSYGQTITVRANFATVGQRFLQRIASRPQNFTWTAPAGVSLISDQGYVRSYQNVYNPQGFGCSSQTTGQFSVRFFDQNYNNHAPNYNTTLITSGITLYTPPAPVITGVNGSAPPRPRNTGGGCGDSGYGATIRVSVNLGNHAGVAGSSCTYYVNGTPFFSGGGYWDSGQVFCGGTTYSIFVINNFGCQSGTVNFTTPSYV